MNVGWLNESCFISDPCKQRRHSFDVICVVVIDVGALRSQNTNAGCRFRSIPTRPGLLILTIWLVYYLTRERGEQKSRRRHYASSGYILCKIYTPTRFSLFTPAEGEKDEPWSQFTHVLSAKKQIKVGL